MPSGERIQFGPNVNFLFESHDLSCASPATISRMGMIFLRYVHMHVLKYKIVCLNKSIRRLFSKTSVMCGYLTPNHFI